MAGLMANGGDERSDRSIGNRHCPACDAAPPKKKPRNLHCGAVNPPFQRVEETKAALDQSTGK